MAVDYAALAEQARNPKTVDYGALAEQARGKKEKESESADYGPLGSYYYGLGTSLAGIPGETEKFIGRTIPETLVKGGQFLGLVHETYKFPEEKPYETSFPTTSEVQETLEKMGLKRPSKGLAESLGEVAPAIFGLGKAGAETASSLKNYLSSKKSAKELMEALRTQLGGLTKEQVTGAETAGKASQTKLERQQKIQEQLSAREQVAGERARTATTAVPGQLATEANVRQEVANRAKAASAKAMRDAQAAGLNAQDAKIAADDAGRKVLMAQSAIDDLEAAMAKRPGMSKDEFGEVIRTITKKLHADAMQNRANQSGLGQVIANGDRVRNVSTKGINDYIDTVLRSTKDPNLRTALATLKRELRNEVEQNAEFFLTLKQAQSLKTYIDDIVNSREFGKSGKESAIKYQFGKIKAQLLEKMKDNNQAFVDALAKWRSLSRPLDIVERNGALRPVIARDPVSLEYRLSEAEVAGKVIAKANAGHPVFTRLLAEDPSIRESARLYYVQELFGGDTAPTQRTLDLFLRNNERSLTQLGIKDEFASLSQARKTAQAAVDEATEEKASAEAASRVAARTATAAESKAAEARSLAKRSESRLAESLKTATSAEDLAKASAARTKSIELKTKNTIEKLQKAVSESVDTKRKYEKMVADLEASPVEKADAEAKKIINDLYENKIIDIDQYKSFNKELADIQDKFGKSDRAKALVRAALRKIGLYSGLGIAGSLGYFGTELAIGQ